MSSWTTFQFETADADVGARLAERVRDDEAVFAPRDEGFSVRQFDEMVYVETLRSTHSDRELSARELVARYAESCTRAGIATASTVTMSGRAILYECTPDGLERVVHMRGEEQKALADVVIRFEETHGFRLRATASANHGGKLNFGIKFYDATEGFDPMYETAKELEEETDVERLDQEWWD